MGRHAQLELFIAPMENVLIGDINAIDKMTAETIQMNLIVPKIAIFIMNLREILSNHLTTIKENINHFPIANGLWKDLEEQILFCNFLSLIPKRISILCKFWEVDVPMIQLLTWPLYQEKVNRYIFQFHEKK